MTKPYTEEINRKNPTFFLFLVDQSGSMAKPFGGQSDKTKAQGVADAINRLFYELVIRCSEGGEIRDWFYMGLIGYNNAVNAGFGGALVGKYQASVSEVGNHPLRVETRTKRTDDGAGGILQQKISFPVWLDPVAEGKTKMCEALGVAKELAADFVNSCPDSFPPIVINITDGMPTDATKPHFPEVEQAATDLKSIANHNGSSVLLFNIHLSSEPAEPILYPSFEEQLTDHFARLLFRMSSQLTDEMRKIANMLEVEMPIGARGFVFQADLVSVVELLDIGTRRNKNR